MPTKPPRIPLAPRGRASIAAIVSPARQELISVLGAGPATVRELSGRLGRSRQSLYYHLLTLQRAKLVTVHGTRGTGRDAERVYAVAGREIALGARPDAPAELEAMERLLASMLRVTMREVTAVLRSPALAADPSCRPVAIRGKARLSPAQLNEIHVLLERIRAILGGPAKTSVKSRRLYAMTVVLTPARESAADWPDRR